MMAAPELRLIEGDAEADAAVPPKVFVRILSGPPGAPWDQARSVALEGRMGAPLPLEELFIEYRRIEPWGWGRPARFVVCYVRRAEVAGEFRARVEADGRSLSVRFRPPSERGRSVGRLGLVGALAVAIAVLGASAISAALAARSDAEDRLAQLEQRAAVRLREAKAQARAGDEARVLKAVGAGQQTVDTLLADLAWVSQAKAPGAHIDALHWERGYLGVEARGATPPFSAPDRVVLKADRSLRPGVWLWGVAPREPPAHRWAAGGGQ